MPKVAIIYPYFRTRSPTEILFPPLGAASLARQLRGFGIDTKVFDCTFINISQLKNKLNAYQPDIVGIYSMVTLSHNVFQIVEIIPSGVDINLTWQTAGPRTVRCLLSTPKYIARGLMLYSAENLI